MQERWGLFFFAKWPLCALSFLSPVVITVLSN